jgi:hypothetical protein
MNNTTDCHILREALRRAENALNFFINDEGECDVGALDEVREVLAYQQSVKSEQPEARALNLYLDELQAAGFTAESVDNGGDLVPTPTRAEVLSEALATGEAAIGLRSSHGHLAWVSIVLGNCLHELICDYCILKDPEEHARFEDAITRVSESLE